MRQIVMAESMWWSKEAHFMVDRRPRDREKAEGIRYTLPGHTPVTYFLHLGPTS
jgi:hypothetical protein